MTGSKKEQELEHNGNIQETGKGTGRETGSKTGEETSVETRRGTAHEAYQESEET